MRDSLLNRRVLLKLSGAGLVTTAVGTKPAIAQSDDLNFDIEYFLSYWGASRTDDGIMQSQGIVFKTIGEIELGPNTIVRIRNTETGAAIEATPESSRTVPGDTQISCWDLYDNDGELVENPEISVLEDDWVDVDVSVEGDTDVFTGGSVFSTYQVEILDAESGEPIATTVETPIGIGVERLPIQQNGTAGEIDLSLEFPESLDESWYVDFSTFIPDDGFQFQETTIENPGTDILEWTVDFSGSEPGTYNGWAMRIYPDEDAPTSQSVLTVSGSSFVEDDQIVIEGGSDDSIEIEDWHDLNAVRDDLTADYELVADLDEDTPGYNEHVADPEDGFEPIGSEEPFTGTFDGSGRTVADLTIDRPDGEGVGLFGTADDATIQDVTLTRATIIGDSDVGTAVGTAEGETAVEAVTADGTVEGSDDEIGGIVGQTRDAVIVTNADSAVDVTGRDDVGGIVGENDDEAIIRDSVATGTVEWLSDGADISFSLSIGGIVGGNDSANAIIENCRSEADVNVLDNYEFDEESDANGDVSAGVLAGSNDGLIEKCTTTGTVTVEDNPDSHPEENRRTTVRIGGIVGNNSTATAADEPEGRVRRCNSVGTIDASNSDGVSAGGITGVNFGTVEDCFATGTIGAEDGSGFDLGGLVGENSGGVESDGVIERCFAAVDPSVNSVDNPSLGGVIGDNGPETAETVAADLYWDTELSDVEVGIANEGGTITNVTGLSSAEMQGEVAAENMDGLDFDQTWNVATHPDDYPILQWHDVPRDDPAFFTVEIVSPDDGEEVTEDEPLDVVVDVTNTGESEAEQAIELTTPIEDDTDVELAGEATETVSFEIPGDEMNGDVEITVESPDDTDQVTVTAADPCFIATAAYDTPTADEIDVLRDFRDDVLQRNALGRLFIKTYYRGSPPIARWIRRNSTRRELVKEYFVEPLVTVVESHSNRRKPE